MSGQQMSRTSGSGTISSPAASLALDGVHGMSRLAAVEKAKEALAIRRRRDAIFGMDQFGEPAWDIILELFVAGAEGRQVAVKSACIGSGVPMSTALRRIKRLVGEGVIRERKRDRGERYLLELDETVAKTLEEVLLGRS